MPKMGVDTIESPQIAPSRESNLQIKIRLHYCNTLLIDT
jgi:hypothetical protein